MFGMSWTEIMIILAVGMFVLGPERIPVAVKWVGSTLRTVRTMAAGAQEQLRGEFGPEIDELRRQIEDLQSLKEIQELRSLRDLNPRSMLTKNLLGDDFSGGVSGFLGLNQPADGQSATGSGVAPEVPAFPPAAAPPPAAPDPTAGSQPPAAPAEMAPVFAGATPVTVNQPPVTVDDPQPVDLAKPAAPVADEPATGRHAAGTVFDDDAT